ncbi:MAG: peptidase M1 [Saprospiraceae bacterium]
MFLEILSFELKYRIKRPATWAYFLLLFLFGWLIAANGGNGSGSEKAFANSAYEVTSFMMIISIFATMIASAVMGVPVYRDIEHGVKDYFFSYPVREKSYLLGRYVGSFLTLMLISTGLIFGMIVGYKMGPVLGWEEAERFGPLRLQDYWHGAITFLWPNLLFTGTIFFCLVALTRKIFIAYVGSVVFFIAYLVSLTLASDLESKDLVALLDPFGFSAWNELTKYWTPVEQNTLHQSLTGNLLLNRLLWPGVAMLLLLFTLFRFDFARFLGGARAKVKKLRESAETASRPKSIDIPAVSQVFGNGIAFRQMLRQAWLEFKSILRDPYFIGIILGGLLFLFFDGWFGNTIYGTPNRPMTYYMIEAKNDTYILFVLIILVFYTGEVVHRDRGVGFHQIADALPVPTWAIYGGKFLTMVLVAFLLATMVWVIGIFSQTIQGYFHYDFGMYFTDLYLLTFPQYVILAMLAFFVHVLVNKKFLGHVLAIAIYVAFFSMAQFADIDYNMFIYAARPGYLISDMNRFGHFIRPVSWFNGYWLAFGGILLTIGLLLWARGTDSGWRSRLKQMNGRWNWRPGVVLLVALGCFAFTGFTIYHNVSELNTYVGQKKSLDRQAEYEKKYSRYARVYQPKITDVEYHVDLFPEKRSATAQGLFQIRNKSPETIDSLYVNYSFSQKEGELVKFTIDGQSPESILYDSVHQFEIYHLPRPMLPGDSATLEIEVNLAYQGFPNEGYQREIIHNGSFLNSGIFPTFGYNNQKEISSDLQRKKHGLEPKDYVAPPPTDSFGLRNLLFEDDADFVTFEAVISTSPDQIAMAPGRLEEEWEENGRRYFRYRNRGLIQNFFNISSARYAVEEDTWHGANGQEVKIQIYHHPTHNYNLDRLNESVKASMDYFNANFSPFQFQQMRILEFPR